MLSEKDVGILKLMSASNRISKKDIYDLNYITDKIPLEELCISLKEKLETFKEQEYKTIFDLKEELNPIDNPSLLIGFDKGNIMYGAPPHFIQKISWIF